MDRVKRASEGQHMLDVMKVKIKAFLRWFARVLRKDSE